MKKKIIAILFSALLLTGSCAPTKNLDDECCQEKTEVVSKQNDPIMKLLLSGLIIYSVHILFAR